MYLITETNHKLNKMPTSLNGHLSKTKRDYNLSHNQKYNQNKWSMGHIAHLRKQFKSINTYDYIIKLIERGTHSVSTF